MCCCWFSTLNLRSSGDDWVRNLKNSHVLGRLQGEGFYSSLSQTCSEHSFVAGLESLPAEIERSFTVAATGGNERSSPLGVATTKRLLSLKQKAREKGEHRGKITQQRCQADLLSQRPEGPLGVPGEGSRA